jgi:ubiquitin thioesterase protein OTUB1
MLEFCQREVEPMGKECEHLQVSALTECLQIHVTIEYLDGRSSSHFRHHNNFLRAVSEGSNPVRNIQFPTREEDDTVLHADVIETFLLYRPGHYDILYRSEAEEANE